MPRQHLLFPVTTRLSDRNQHSQRLGTLLFSRSDTQWSRPRPPLQTQKRFRLLWADRSPKTRSRQSVRAYRPRLKTTGAARWLYQQPLHSLLTRRSGPASLTFPSRSPRPETDRYLIAQFDPHISLPTVYRAQRIACRRAYMGLLTYKGFGRVPLLP